MNFYLHYTLRALRRGGQRTVLVIISVAFGVMALVTMQLLSAMITDALLGDPRVIRGGDITIDYQLDRYLSPDDLVQLDSLKADGRIDDYTLIARTFTMLIKPENGTKTAFVMYAQGVDPAVFPLIGEVKMREPDGADLAAAISTPGHIAVTRDMAADLDLAVGDSVLVTDGLSGAPRPMTVGGVIEMMPDHLAKSVIYSLETAQLIANNSQVLTGAVLTVPGAGAIDALADELEWDGWHVMVAHKFSQSQQKIRDIFNFGLKGAGMLALVVGGIGVANTMQVMLARRTTEIAVLKTLGYRQRHLLALFGLETVLVGIAGSLLGMIVALLLARPLMRGMEGTGIFLLTWQVDASVLISGALAGIATTVIFGFYAILRASAVRPAILLRQFSAARAWRRWTAAMGVYAVLALPFSIVSTFIMGSVGQGLGVIAFALAGFLALGLIMGGALWLVTRLPLPRIHLLTLARNNLKRQQLRLVFALIALFVGVVAIGFAVATISAAKTEFDDRLGSLDGPNLILFGQRDQDAAIQAALNRLDGVKAMHVHYPAELSALEVLIDESWQPLQLAWLDGRRYDLPAWGLDLTGDAWGSAADGVYLPQALRSAYQGLQPGMALRLQGSTGIEQILTLAGFYDLVDDAYMNGDIQPSAIISHDMAAALSTPQATVIYEGEIQVSQIDAATEHLGTAIPAAMVISAGDIRAVVQGILFSLLAFVITIAGFALVAGAILIANAVGLAMIERRREIGVMKAVGYTSRHVLT
ncbi:MAG: FtsX-like permease family protein, partial [Anaerolineae bacterium]|nr:FtsX-like permease family protein [Anaerolineae bacterium]